MLAYLRKATTMLTITDFLQDIVDEIITYYPNVNITGVIIDYYDDAVIVEFLIDSSGNVIFDRDL